ncbi:class I SAM-dependent methyltransferase [Streptomyces sp. URMC 123]|uniref:class I SAM-dependent methyltransferase n=1 Tax=Streptomyces sp. URMC 123 TaxID=3423403 RepID=UPI003F196964
MTMPEEHRAYWETSGAAKTFTHPLDPDLLAAEVPPDARILDYGCGYGRLMDELDRRGYRDVRGVDFSAALVARGRAAFPHLRFTHAERLPLDFPDGSFDAVLLFAVLTCVPGDAERRAAVAEVARLLRPGGVLYLSDVPLQSDEVNVRRYEENLPRHGVYGVFEAAGGGVFRHHDPDALRALLTGHGLTPVTERHGAMPTLDGVPVTGAQVLARRTP